MSLRNEGPAGAIPGAPRQSGDPIAALDQPEEELEEYDPWEPFNENTFAFNYNLDKHAIKPVAKAYDKVVPNFVEHAISNIFENIGSFRRIINLAVQGRFNDTGQEFGRFVINTIFGLGGFVDAAPSFGVGKVDADAGQTFGVWGAGSGPYLVIPFFEPLTVRDAVGAVVDAVMDPTTWLVPFEVGFGAVAVKKINDRAMNLELYESVEESVFDLYGAVRNAYLQQRRAAIRAGRAARKHMRSGSDSVGASALPASSQTTLDMDLAGSATVSRNGFGLFELDRKSFLIVDAAPSDAEVFLDGRLLGSAAELVARGLPLSPGQHALAIAAKGFRPYSARFVADSSFSIRIRVALGPE